MTHLLVSSSVEQKVWDVANKYRHKLEFESVVSIWSDMIYLFAMVPEFAALVEQPITNLKLTIEQLEAFTLSNDTEAAVVTDFEENVRNTVLPRTDNATRISLFNEIREDGLSLVRLACDRVSLIEALQQIHLEFGTDSGGSYATPIRINELMAKLAATNLKRQRSITGYDPSAGTGGSLLALKRVLDTTEQVNLLGQELNPQAFIRANMVLDLISDDNTSHNLKNSDALLATVAQNDLRADVVITDPPYSLRWNPEPGLVESGPYSDIGVLPPKSKADFAFVLHGLSHLTENGTMVIQLPHGVLFRGGSEAKIRQYLVQHNYIDAVIGLPANLQYETSIPTMLLVLRKNRSRKNVLFIDASAKVEKLRSINILPELSVAKIIETYQNYNDINQYSHVASLNEIIGNDYNLNIPRYVDSFLAPKTVSIRSLKENISSLDGHINTLAKDAEEIMSKYLQG